MTAQLPDSVAGAALNDVERLAIERIADLLRTELGEDLLALWLYGSRARGEADPDETDDDRRSDIDMIVIVDSSRDVTAFKRELTLPMFAAVEAEGDSPVFYSLHVYGADRLRNRREIRSFFFQEVDRDKIILAGSALEGGEYG